MRSHHRHIQKKIGLKRKIYLNLEREKNSSQSEKMMTHDETMIINNMTYVIKNLEQSKRICDIIDPRQSRNK